MNTTTHIHLTHPLLARIGAIADAAGAEIYVVGGYVRDLLLERDQIIIDRWYHVRRGDQRADAVMNLHNLNTRLAEINSNLGVNGPKLV